MHIDPDLAAFLSSAVTIVIGTASGDIRPEIGRAVGAQVAEDGETVEVVVSAWQWPDTVANVDRTCRAAVTFARPSDYACYQLKGRAVTRKAGAADLALAERYMATILAELERLGLAPGLAAPWLMSRDAVVVRLEPELAFVQTPGAKAGQSREGRE